MPKERVFTDKAEIQAGGIVLLAFSILGCMLRSKLLDVPAGKAPKWRSFRTCRDWTWKLEPLVQEPHDRSKMIADLLPNNVRGALEFHEFQLVWSEDSNMHNIPGQMFGDMLE